MKKYGKYEKRPEGIATKQPKVKSALLQTYLTSLLCMVLCVTMFFGTSYAWFTSEVTNSANEIYVGTLKVGFYKLDNGSRVNLASSDSNGKLFDGDIRWEPGYTTLETIEIVNEGDLAFKYTLNFTDGAIADGGDLAAVAENFEVWLFDHYKKEYVKPVSYTAMAESSGWVKIGTLADVLNGKSVLKDENMRTVRQDDLAEGETTPTIAGIPDGVATTDTYTIALHMKKDASDASLMGKKITLNVKLVAYQMSKEQDGFGNSNYDNVRFVSTVDELQKALDNATGGEIINLANNITGNVTVTQKPDVQITIDGNDHKFNGVLTVDGKSNRYETAALTVKNVDFDAETLSADAFIRLGYVDAARYTNNVTVKDCTFSFTGNTKVAAVKSYTGGDWNLTIDGCTVNVGMHSLAQLANVEKGLKITNCKVYSKNGANLNNTPSMEMSDCAFDVQGYAVRFGIDANTTDENFTIKDSVLKSECAAADDAVIVFRAGACNATLTLSNVTLVGDPQFLGHENANINGQ